MPLTKFGETGFARRDFETPEKCQFLERALGFVSNFVRGMGIWNLQGVSKTQTVPVLTVAFGSNWFLKQMTSTMVGMVNSKTKS